jgi:hypothetical protein
MWDPFIPPIWVAWMWLLLRLVSFGQSKKKLNKKKPTGYSIDKQNMMHSSKKTKT